MKSPFIGHHRYKRVAGIGTITNLFHLPPFGAELCALGLDIGALTKEAADV